MHLRPRLRARAAPQSGIPTAEPTAEFCGVVGDRSITGSQPRLLLSQHLNDHPLRSAAMCEDYRWPCAAT